MSLIFDDCRQLISNLPQVQFSHCYREVNHCVDKHARIRSSHNLDFFIYDNPLMNLLSVFEDDLHGMYLNKLCANIHVLV